MPLRDLLRYLLARCACCGSRAHDVYEGILGDYFLCEPCSAAPCFHHITPLPSHWEHRVGVGG